VKQDGTQGIDKWRAVLKGKDGLKQFNGGNIYVTGRETKTN